MVHAFSNATRLAVVLSLATAIVAGCDRFPASPNASPAAPTAVNDPYDVSKMVLKTPACDSERGSAHRRLCCRQCCVDGCHAEAA